MGHLGGFKGDPQVRLENIRCKDAQGSIEKWLVNAECQQEPRLVGV